MNEVQQNILSTIKAHSLYSTVLAITLAFFIYKGLRYALAGSYVPLGFILLISALFVLNSRRTEKAFKNALKLWAVLIITWAAVRLLLGLTNQFIKPIPESHVAEQLGVLGSILSLLFLFAGIYLWRKKGIF